MNILNDRWFVHDNEIIEWNVKNKCELSNEISIRKWRCLSKNAQERMRCSHKNETLYFRFQRNGSTMKESPWNVVVIVVVRMWLKEFWETSFLFVYQLLYL